MLKRKDRIKPTTKSAVKSVLSLAFGTAFGQAATFAAAPFLTRIYNPADFGNLALYVSTLSILTVAASLRYDLAIPMAKTDRHAINLLAVSLGFILFCAVAVFGILALASILLPLGSKPPSFLLTFLPIGVLAAATYQGLAYWATRKRRFQKIAVTKAQQGIGAAAIQLAFGLIQLTGTGLLIGHLAANTAGLGTLARDAWRNNKGLAKSVTLKRMAWASRKYCSYPKYSLWEGLANAASNFLPIILIASMTSAGTAGFFMLAQRILQAPLALIGSSVGQVFLANAPQHHSRGELGRSFDKTVVTLAAMAAIPLLVTAVFGPQIFTFLFGQNWGQAGKFAAWMSPWIFLQFIASPVSIALTITGNQRSSLISQVAFLIIRPTAFLIATHLYSDEFAVIVFCISGAFCYGAFLLWLRHTINRSTA